MRKYIFFLFCFTAVLVSANIARAQPAKADKTYAYETAPNDPLKARIYKLENGLTVYMSIYKNTPRIQTYIAVRAGSKNDPSDATGLAHYLEHMVFKGTDKYGCLDYSQEEPLIKKIEELYETYRETADDMKRKALYHTIDSLSGVAAKYAIANEYDKMMASIGAQGTNAYTWVEQTVYVNDIPSNQLEKWLRIEAERFRKPVLRIFHTELEAVYEEKNRSLDNDGSKVFEALFSGLWQKHTYGTQTTIGTIDHLKNPSLKKIMEYYNTYYVPNNMALCISGDFDPEQTIRLIDKTLGTWKPKAVPVFNAPQENPITQPIVKEVLGPDAERITIGFQFKGAGTRDADMITLTNKILYNGTAGLLDLNLNQSQKVLSSLSYEMILKDYSAHVLTANAKNGQKLEEVKDLLLSEIEKVKRGEFPDWLPQAIINNMKLEETRAYEQNSARADAFVSAYILNQPWKDYVNSINRISTITKQEIMDFAKASYKDNYVVVYKRTGEDKNVQKVMKPEITPVTLNRETQSPFTDEVLNIKSDEIQPVFIDYKKDILTLKLKNNVPVLYTENKENKTFDLYYVLDMGSNNERKLAVAIEYLEFLGTSTYSPSELREEFYKLGCSYGVYNSEDKIYVSLSGLSDNFDKALQLFEELLSDAQPNAEALASLVDDLLKKRANAKLNKNIILRAALFNYGTYGPKSPYTNILSEAELKVLKPEELIAIIKELNGYEHRVLYYGPKKPADLTAVLNTHHKMPATLKPVPPPVEFGHLPTGGKVFVVDYDMKQAEVILLSKSLNYTKENIPVISLFNEYFGAGMSSVVFQEIRESKALAYSVASIYRTPSRKDKPHYVYSYVGTQADKLPEALESMMSLMNEMPKAETNFNSAKNAIVQGIRTERIIKSDILFDYESALRLGLDYDIRKDIFEKAPPMKLDDINAFHQKHFKNQQYTLLVVGKKDNLDMKTLEKYGQVTFLKLEDVFGY